MALAALLTAVAACGVGTEAAPRVVEAPPGPFPSPTTVDLPPAAGRVTETLCFVRDDRLVPVARRVVAAPTADAQLRHLLAGPTAGERAAGLTSALAGVTGAGVTGVVAGEARVTVAGAGDDNARSDELIAFGQIVCTLTARDDVTAVSFLRGGRPLGVPRADGALSPRPLTADDYTALLAGR
ncbi:GerMN domain-containing protein [Micromonospora olivasterospora]|uniref:GerMN domain-containing protein n=1 Tax=Micromonospora olivasterospora TaxID=1880 RepID=UPI00119DA702|nr:GerMN domain-containing protein [Micromonospora olivasterospora]